MKLRLKLFVFSMLAFTLFGTAAVLSASETPAASDTPAPSAVPAVSETPEASETSEAAETSEEVPEQKLRVAVYRGKKAGGAKFLARIIETDSMFECVIVSGDEIRNGALDQCNFVVLPGGSGRAQARSMQPEGVEKLKKFVHDGNGYLGICAGAYFPMQQEFLNGKTKSPKWVRGIEQLDIELTEEGLEVFGEEFRGIQKVRYANGPVFDINIDPNKPKVDVLAWFRSEVARNDTPVGIQVNSPAMVRTTYGSGMVFTFSPHPENSKTLKVFLPKALRYMALKLQMKPKPRAEKPAETPAETLEPPAEK